MPRHWYYAQPGRGLPCADPRLAEAEGLDKDAESQFPDWWVRRAEARAPPSASCPCERYRQEAESGWRLLLVPGLVGDLDELGFPCSGGVGSCAWRSSLVVFGHCRAEASDGPETAQLCRARLTAGPFDTPRLNLSRRQSAPIAETPTDHARVCLAAPPPASATLLMPSTRASTDGRPVTKVLESSAWEAEIIRGSLWR
jgi:hypothetical protein